MSFEDANPFKKLDKLLFKDAEDPKGKKQKDTLVRKTSAATLGKTGNAKSSCGKGAAVNDVLPEEGAADFMRAMTGVARLEKSKSSKTGGGASFSVKADVAGTVAHGKGSQSSQDEGIFSMADLEEFKQVAKKGTSQKIKSSHEDSEARKRSRDAVVQRETLTAKQADDIQSHGEDAEEDVFIQAMEGVSGITSRGRDIRKRPELVQKGQGAAHAAQALQDLLDGTIEFQLEYTEEFIQGHVSGFDPVVLGKLRAGQYSPEAHLDLHGMVAQEAYDALVMFMRMAYNKGMRNVLLIPGRGKNSPEGFGVLRQKMQHWLTRDPFKRVVLAFCSAQPRDGGAGAVYVMLRKMKKSHGKIQWERTPSDPDLFV